MGVKLNVKDRKLLEIYTDHANIPIKQLATRVGISREVASYRIKRLKKHGIISKVVAKIDMTRFYQTAYSLFLRFSKLDQLFLTSAINFLSNSPYVMWVSPLCGEYDVGISFLTRTPNDLTMFMQSIQKQFGTNLAQYDLFHYDKEYKNTYRTVFEGKSDYKSEALIKDFTPEKLKIKLDRKDKAVLYALSNNAELTNEKLSKLVGLSEEAVRKRIKQYEKGGIIKGYRALIDLPKLGMSLYYIFLRLDNMTDKDEKKFETIVETIPNIYYCAKIIGKFNVQASVWAHNPVHFQKMLHELRNAFPEKLTSFNSQIMFSERKHTYFPPAAIIDEVDVEKIDDFLQYKSL